MGVLFHNSVLKELLFIWKMCSVVLNYSLIFDW